MKYEEVLSELKAFGDDYYRLKILSFLLNEVEFKDSEWRYQGIDDVKSSIEKFLDNYEKQDFYINLETDFESVIKLDSNVLLSGESLFRRQAKNCYGHVKLEISDFAGENDFLIQWRVDDETIYPGFRYGVIRGVKGWGMRNKIKGLLIKIVGGSYHEVDSHDMDFAIATNQALDKAFEPVDYEKPEKVEW